MASVHLTDFYRIIVCRQFVIVETLKRGLNNELLVIKRHVKQD